VHAREVERGVAEHQLAQRGSAAQLGAEHRHGLRVRAAVQRGLDVAQRPAHLRGEVPHRRLVAGRLRRGAARSTGPTRTAPAPPQRPPRTRAAPSRARACRGRRGTACGRRTARRAGGCTGGGASGASERRCRTAWRSTRIPTRAADREQVVPQPHHRRHEPPGRALEVAVSPWQYSSMRRSTVTPCARSARRCASTPRGSRPRNSPASSGHVTDSFAPTGVHGSPVSSTKYGAASARRTHGSVGMSGARSRRDRRGRRA
jgi:hypothetical protein